MPLTSLSAQYIINCDLCTVGNKIQKHKNMTEINYWPSIHIERSLIQPPQSFDS